MATGIDLVREQILVAQGAPLSFTQDDAVLRGHAIECRVNAEDPTTFLPSPGRVTRYREPAGPGVRVDSALEQGGEVVALYDPMVAKLVVWDRDPRPGPGAHAAGAGRDGRGGRPHADPAPPADHGRARVRARRDVRGPGGGRLAAPAGRLGRAARGARRPGPQPQLRRRGRRPAVRGAGPRARRPRARRGPPPARRPPRGWRPVGRGRHRHEPDAGRRPQGRGGRGRRRWRPAR